MISGHPISSTNGLFAIQTYLIGNRAHYISSNGLQGIWFNDRNGVNQWVVGNTKDLNQGRIAYGYRFGENKNAYCPTTIQQWKDIS